MRKLLLLVAPLLILAFGVGEALWTDRWSLSRELEQATAKLSSVPLTVGDWVGKDSKLDPRQVARAEMTGYLLRVYVNRNTGKSLQVLLVCGRGGPISKHPPEVCFEGGGYTMDGPPLKQPFQGSGQEALGDFWVGRFHKTGPTPSLLRLYWSWTATGNWTAAAYPPWTFGGYPFLYKLYVIHPLSKLDEPAAEDPAPEFLRQFLPELRTCLVRK